MVARSHLNSFHNRIPMAGMYGNQSSFEDAQTQGSEASPESQVGLQRRSSNSSSLQSPRNDDVKVDTQGNDRPKVRLRKACDSCSIRKIKCDESGPPCLPCASLDIPCTFERPSRRRGPPNRHAESIKKRRLEAVHPSVSSASSPTSPAGLDQQLQHAVLTDPDQRMSAELICPVSLLQPLIDDYFVYIHPLVPIPHEPTFRAAWARRDDLRDRTFLSLVASMIGSLVVSFPRKPRLHLKAQKQDALFPNYMNLVDRCHRVAIEARGVGFLDNYLTIYDATTSYLLGLTTGYAFRWRQSKLYFGECLNIVRALGFHKESGPASPPQAFHPSVSTLGAEQSDFVVQELGRRLFWVLFVGIRSIHQLGASVSELYMPPETPQEPYPPLPLEVDDEYITPTEIFTQPPGITSALVGFNANVRVYLSYSDLLDMYTTYNMTHYMDWEKQSRVVQQCLTNCKSALNGLPPELLLQHNVVPANPHNENGPSGTPQNEAVLQGVTSSESMQLSTDGIASRQKRKLQMEIQKANIYVSQLTTRSHIVERYWMMCESLRARGAGPSQRIQQSTIDYTPSPNGDDRGTWWEHPEISMAAEREKIVHDLLSVLGSINQVNMEPNGGSLINKIRQIASTLLDVPSTRQGQLAARSREHLMTLVELLMKLERVPPRGAANRQEDGNSMAESGSAPSLAWTDIDEEAELRHWADLREYQSRFAQSGGLLHGL